MRFSQKSIVVVAVLAGFGGLTVTASPAVAAPARSAAVAAPADPATQTLISRGSTHPVGRASAERFGGLRATASFEGAAAGSTGTAPGPDRSTSRRGGRHSAGTVSTRVTPAPPGRVRSSFRGLNLAEQAATAGFNLEPPDQGLCVGKTAVLELVNVVGRAYQRSGAPLTDPFYLNDFFKEDPDLANASDPSCYYDPDTNRFFADMLFYDSDPADPANLTGTNRIDVAVSDTGDPTGTWQVYTFDVTKDGASAFNIGDYPQLGADREGFYITTNSYPFFDDGFTGAQLYAMSKHGLTTGTDTRVTHVPVPSGPGGRPFTLRPTTSPADGYAREANGTEHMLSSLAGEETGNTTGLANAITLWALSGTNTLAPAQPRSLVLRQADATVDGYGVPPASDQKAGPFPLGQCLSVTACRTAVFPRLTTPAGPHQEGPLDSSDSRMHQTVQSGGLVYGALDTVVNVNGQDKAGIAWYVVRPVTGLGGALRARIVSQGKLALPNNNLDYPAFALTPAGDALMTMNVVGQDYYPSIGYVTFDRLHRPSPVRLTTLGVGPQDGFSEYPEFGNAGVARPRWGDYAVTAVDPVLGTIWTGNEYIAQSCTLATYQSDPTCGGTRTRFGNWATRITEIRP